MAKEIKKVNNCDECVECQYIGDGDFACVKNEEPVLIKSKWLPTQYYNNCKGCRTGIKERSNY